MPENSMRRLRKPRTAPTPAEASPVATTADASLLGRLMRHRRSMDVAFIAILVIAALFRFHGLNWDDNRHLHPDERFLSTVTNDIKWPDSFANYFDPSASTLSPYTLKNVGLFVYGTLPVYIVKWAAIALNDNNYDKITLVGRALSGLFDIAAICMLFLIGRRLYGRAVAMLAALLLALSVFNIQLSHFYAVDTYANLFILATFYFLLRASESGRWADYAITGLLFGMGLASKVTALTLLVPLAVGIGLDHYRRLKQADTRLAFEQTVVRTITVVFLAALVFRIAQPMAFAGPGFSNWSLNPRWTSDMAEQQKTVTGGSDQPWIQQWTDRSAAFPLYNIVVWGLGLPLGVAAVLGFLLALYELLRNRMYAHLLPVLYVAATFTYHASNFVKFMRYFLPIYPFLVLFAAYLIVRLWQKAFAPRSRSALGRPAFQQGWRGALAKAILSRPVAAGIALVVIVGTLLYASAFSTIYSRTNSRVAASRWMYLNIPAGSTLANEHWDDWLPIGGLDGKAAYGDNGLFKSVEMANYEDDTPAKLDKMVQNLTQADYIVLSSNRLYGSIPRLPIRYPMTSRYYQLLFGGQLGFERVAIFTSYPQLFGLQIADQVAEESFTVYDHPKVQIFRKTAAFNPDLVRQELGLGIAWDSVIHMTPLQVTQAPNGLQLSPSAQTLYRQVAAWSSAEVSVNSLGTRVPLLAWIIALLVIGMLAMPLTFAAFGRLADRGYIVSKAVGLLVVAWAAWLVASIRLAPFTWWLILIVLALMGIASAVVASRSWTQLRRFLVARWRLLAFEEALFWVFFGIMLFIRLHNPDLWHPGTGGEKPMDVAYLNAIVRTPYFPSYDPWFTGGYINYYYFGFVLVAALIHLTGIVPYFAYNLAVPTFFAMTSVAAFSAVFNLAKASHGMRLIARGRWLRVAVPLILVGLAGTCFVAVIGNLAQVELIWNGILDLSKLPADSGSSVLAVFARFLDGLNQWISGRQLPIHLDWWYWNATRVIPPGQGEAGPINEMPFFTYLFADLHAHAMALPYTIVTLLLSINILFDVPHFLHRRARAKRAFVLPAGVFTMGLLALTTGALWPMNTWDFPTYTGLAAVALLLREIRRRNRLDWSVIGAALWRVAMFVAVGYLLFLPFHQNYASAYFGAELWKGSRTPLSAYLFIHGFFLFIIVSYFLSELFAGRGHNPLIRSLRLSLRHWRRTSRLHSLFDHLTHPTSGFRLAVSLGRFGLAAAILLLILDPVVGLALDLALFAGLLLWSRPHPRRQFVLVMIGLGLVLTAVVEFVVLKGDISRMNTVFKFYLQVWVLWAIASAGVLPDIGRRLGGRGAPVALPIPGIAVRRRQSSRSDKAPPVRSRTPVGAWAQRWWWAFGILFAACLLYPVTAAPHRIEDRFKDSTAVTLNGMAYMRTSVYMDDGRPVTLEWDRQAIDWLRSNLHGLPTILEANTPLYRWGSRVSIYTGFPTVIGWDWHQKQQRSVMPGQIVDRRIEDVRTIYNTTDVTQAVQLLKEFNVNYIYVGALERLYYDPNGLAKFDQPSPAWSLIYHNDQVEIFEVH
jgi:YYY domain-containing protein